MRLIDANALITLMKKGWRLFPSSELRHTCDITDIENAPTIDAVPVVRCKDCKHYSEDGWGYGNCYRPNVDYLRMNERGFCSWGERREDGIT